MIVRTFLSVSNFFPSYLDVDHDSCYLGSVCILTGTSEVLIQKSDNMGHQVQRQAEVSKQNA